MKLSALRTRPSFVQRGRIAPHVSMVLLALLAVATLLAPGTSEAGAKLRLGLATSPAPALPNSVLWLAKDLGFYKREGLDVELIELRGTPSVIKAMRTGDVDVGNVSTSKVVGLVARKTLGLRAIHSPDSKLYFLIASQKGLNSAAELKGKTFGIGRVGSLDHSMSMNVLTALGVNPDDLKLVAVGKPSVRAKALVGGRMDATTVSLATWVTIKGEKGVKVLLDPDKYYAAAPIVLKVNAVTDKVLKGKPGELQRFTAAIIKTSRHFAENKEAWVDAIAKRRSDLDRRDVTDLWKTFKTSWAVNGLMNLKLYGKTADFLYNKTGWFKKVPKIGVRDWADTQFVDKVLREIGVYSKFDDPGRAVR